MIEILVVRDPDSENELRLWIDGVEVSTTADEGVNVVDIDAGAGYSYDDWRDTADAWERDPDLSDSFREAVREAYADPPGREYIDGFPHEEGNYGSSTD